MKKEAQSSQGSQTRAQEPLKDSPRAPKVTPKGSQQDPRTKKASSIKPARFYRTGRLGAGAAQGAKSRAPESPKAPKREPI